MPYNIITCKGFGDVTSWIASSGCFQARIGIVILFFVIALLRKWVFDITGLPFNFWIAEGVSILSYFIVVTIFGSFKIAFAVAIVAGCAAGYFGGIALGSDGE